MEIKFIAGHNTGGLGANQKASTIHLKPRNISEYHKQKWNFPSKFITDEEIRYAGYNAIYDPKTRTFTQCRAIGEETASQRGYNFNTFSLCIIGNYNKGVDKMDSKIEHDVTKYLHDLIDGNKQNLVVAPGTKINLSVTRVNPHRYYQTTTKCYGTALSDNWLSDLLIGTVVNRNEIEVLEERLAIYQKLLKAYLQILQLFRDKNARKTGSLTDRDCGI